MNNKPIYVFVLSSFVGTLVALTMAYGLYATYTTDVPVPWWGLFIIGLMILLLCSGIIVTIYGMHRALRRSARLRAALDRI